MEEMTPKMAELCGMHMGDGCISITKKYREYALLGDMVEEKTFYDNYVVPLFNRELAVPLTGIKINPKKYEKMGVYGIITFKREIVEAFLRMGFKPGSKLKQEIPKLILKSTEECKKAFLRGLFDTDGTIYFEKNYTRKNSGHIRPKIKIGLVSKKTINQLEFMVEEFGFSPMEKKEYKGKRDKNPIYSFVIHRKGDIKKWIGETGSNSEKHKTKSRFGENMDFVLLTQLLKREKECWASYLAKLKVIKL